MKKALLILGILAIAVLAVVSYAGFFRKVELKENMPDRYTLVLKKARGEYSQAGVVLDEVYKFLKENGVESEMGVGIYFDDPRTVKKEDLRWVGGCVLPAKSRGKIGVISKKYMVREFKPVKSVITVFPFRNRLNLIAGISKVYPALARYAKENELPNSAVIEIYDMKAREIIYIRPIVKGWNALKLFYEGN